MGKRSLLIKRIREMKPESTEKRDCYICDSFKEITHCHHVIPVKQIADACERLDFFYVLFPVTFVWLCPNHHAIYHTIIGSKKPMDDKLEVYKYLSKAERSRYGDLSNLESKVWREFSKRVEMEREHDESYVLDYIIEGFNENQDN